MDWALHTPRLRAVLPGVYAPPEIAHLPETRIRAVCLRHPDAVLLTGAAARVVLLARCADATDRRSPAKRDPRTGRLTRSLAAASRPNWSSNAAACASPTQHSTAIDMATFSCSDAIDRALRTRTATLPGMYEALARTSNRIGNPERMRLLLDSRDLPWSAAERLGHRILRRARIRGWQANLPVVSPGASYYIDVAFRLLKVALEIDGRLHEEDEDLFESDRWRQNALVADGWRVLRFTWDMLQEHPEAVVAAVRSVVT